MSDTGFHLDPRLAEDGLPVAELPLCSLLQVDDARWPWLLLVPRRTGCREPFDLSAPEQWQLWQEAMTCAAALKSVTGCDKTNIAAIGNKVAQLHVHIVARSPGDPGWPEPVFGRGEPRRTGRLGTWIAALRQHLAVEPSDA